MCRLQRVKSHSYSPAICTLDEWIHIYIRRVSFFQTYLKIQVNRYIFSTMLIGIIQYSAWGNWSLLIILLLGDILSLFGAATFLSTLLLLVSLGWGLLGGLVGLRGWLWGQTGAHTVGWMECSLSKLVVSVEGLWGELWLLWHKVLVWVETSRESCEVGQVGDLEHWGERLWHWLEVHWHWWTVVVVS